MAFQRGHHAHSLIHLLAVQLPPLLALGGPTKLSVIMVEHVGTVYPFMVPLVVGLGAPNRIMLASS